MVNPLMNHLAFNAIINLAIWPLNPKMYDEDIGTYIYSELPDLQKYLKIVICWSVWFAVIFHCSKRLIFKCM